MVARWKIKREWQRLKGQFEAWTSVRRVRKRNAEYEKNRLKLQSFTEGAHPWQSNCAILLIYQPNGLLRSTLQTCQFLRNAGFSVFAVLNAPLPKAELETLKAEVSLILERPNIGYDFGGYRDAILHVLDMDYNPENLLVLNDSIWFPAVRNTDLLDKLLAHSADVCGPMLQHGKHHEKDHLQSYMMLFGPSVLAAVSFKEFWANFPLPLNRYQAIRGGEMRLTEALKRLGFEIGFLHESSEPRTHTQTLADDELKKVWPFLKWSGRRARRRAARLDFEASDWRSLADELIVASLRDSSPMDTHPLILLEKMGIPYLKKDRNIPYQRQRAELMQRKTTVSLDPVVLGEIETWDD